MPATLRMAQEMGRGMGEREVLLEGLSKMTFTSLRYVAFDQLHEKYGVLRDASPQRDLVVMVESKAIMSSAKWHPERLYFYRSSARHEAEFSGNHRMAQQLHGMRKLVDMPALKERSKVVLEGLSGGEV